MPRYKVNINLSDEYQVEVESKNEEEAEYLALEEVLDHRNKISEYKTRQVTKVEGLE